MVAEALTSDAAHLAFGGALVAASLAVVYKTDEPSGAWTRALRSRFLLGVPWGTLVAVAGVVGVYLFVQSGLENPARPVVIPFRSWSYLYPEGLLWSSFAHANRGHITGNLLSTLVAGGIAEYAFGHFPGGREVDGERGTLRSVLPSRAAVARIRSEGLSAVGFDRGLPTAASLSAAASRGDARALARNPYVRALAIVPGAMALFGVFSSLFVLGPVVGFSGVVFALWGFALVCYPIGAIAALAGTTLVNVAYETLRNPVVTGEASGSYGPPWWANVAIQGHALGLIAGALVAVWLVRRRGRETGSDPDDDSGESDESDESGDGEPFTFGVDEVEECGQTCRDVTATLYNEQAEPASNVTTDIRIYAGENNTDADDVVWEGTVDVGTLDANASETTTQRIDLSFREALKVDQNGGWITIRTTVDSADTTVTFRESRQVA